MKQNNGRGGRGIDGESVAAQAASRVDAHPSMSQPVSFLGAPKLAANGGAGASSAGSAMVSAIGYIGSKHGGHGATSKNGSQYSARPSVNHDGGGGGTSAMVAPPAPTVHTPSSIGGGGAVAAAHAWSNAMVAATTGTTANTFVGGANTSSSSVIVSQQPTVVLPLSPLAAHSSATATTHTAVSSTNVQRYDPPAPHESGIMIGTITRSHSGV